MRKLISILICGLSVAFSSIYAIENVVVDSQSRNVLNTGAINFAPLQLKINGVAVAPGGGGGGSGVTSISLAFPGIFTTPISFVDDGAANWAASATFATQPAFTFFGNGTGSTDVPTFMSLSTARTALLISNVDNTSDANKPVSSAQATINTGLQDGITDNTTDITAINATLGALTLATIPAPASDVSIAGFKITNLGTPTSATDAANKSYVDTAANVGPPHTQVATASTGNLTRSGEQTIDGVLTSTSRVLLKDQTTASENGIYVTAAGAWARATDADTGAEVSGIVFVAGGSTQINTTWGVTTPQPITINTTPIAYTLTGSGGTTYTAGTGLSLAGNQFSLATIATGKVLGNNSGSTAAPTAQNATTVGFNFLGLTNPSAITFPRINADNTVTARSAANFLSDIGAGTVTSVDTSGTNGASDVFTYSFSATTTAPRLTVAKPNAAALTFYGNSSGSSGAPTFMTAATARATLGATTVGTNVFTLTNPSAITFPRFNADNTVSALTASQFLTAVGASPVDSAVLFGNTGGTTGSPFTWTTGATSALQSVAMTGDHWVLLPPAVNYAPGKRIIYTDTVTTLDYGMNFRRSGTDTLNGGTADFKPFIAGATGPFGGKSVEFENVAGTGWQVITTAASIFSVQDPSNSARSVTFDVSSQPINSGFKIIPNKTATGYTLSNLAQTAGNFVVGATEGVLTTDRVRQTDLIPAEFDVGNSDDTITNDGTIDTVKLNTPITGAHIYAFPSATNYSTGEVVRFFDATGSVTTSNYVRVSSSGATFNGNSSITITEPYFNRVFVADPTNNAWTVSTFGGSTGSGLSIDGWNTANPVSGVATLVCNANVTENHHIVNMSGNITVAITGAVPGRPGKIKFFDSTGNHTVTFPNPGGNTPNAGGVGVITTSTGTDVTDLYGWDYDGSKYYFYPLGLNMVQAAAPSYGVIADDTSTGIGTTNFNNQGDVTNFAYGIATKLVANGGVAGGSAYNVGKVRLRLKKVGFTSYPAYNIYVKILADNGAGGPDPNTQIGGSSAAISVSTLSTSEGDIDFTLNSAASLVSGTTYWVVMYGDNAARTVNDGVLNATTTVTSTLANFTSTDVGSSITGGSIPAGTSIASVTNSTTAVMSAAATGSASGVTLNIGLANTSNYVAWAYHTTTGNSAFRSGTGASYSNIANNKLFKFITYKP